jgi:hypothetical protein
MRAVVLHEYGGPEKLKFEDNVPEPQISGSTVLIATAAASGTAFSNTMPHTFFPPWALIPASRPKKH